MRRLAFPDVPARNTATGQAKRGKAELPSRDRNRLNWRIGAGTIRQGPLSLVRFRNGCRRLPSACLSKLAEGAGFEPAEPCGSATFQAAALSPSATLPKLAVGEGFEPPEPLGSAVFKTAAISLSAIQPNAC